MLPLTFSSSFFPPPGNCCPFLSFFTGLRGSRRANKKRDEGGKRQQTFALDGDSFYYSSGDSHYLQLDLIFALKDTTAVGVAAFLLSPPMFIVSVDAASQAPELSTDL